MFHTNANVGANIPVDELQREFNAILLAGGATAARDLPVPGRELKGIHFAMDYLPLQNKRCEGDSISDDAFISAKDKNVVIIGGGDTGADCLGTAHRQGARSIVQFELLPKPPAERAADNPCSSGMSISVPSEPMRRAVFGTRPSRALIAAPVRLRARSSRTCPRRTSVVMTAAASK